MPRHPTPLAAFPSRPEWQQSLERTEKSRRLNQKIFSTVAVIGTTAAAGGLFLGLLASSSTLQIVGLSVAGAGTIVMMGSSVIVCRNRPGGRLPTDSPAAHHTKTRQFRTAPRVRRGKKVLAATLLDALKTKSLEKVLDEYGTDVFSDPSIATDEVTQQLQRTLVEYLQSDVENVNEIGFDVLELLELDRIQLANKASIIEEFRKYLNQDLEIKVASIESREKILRNKLPQSQTNSSPTPSVRVRLGKAEKAKNEHAIVERDQQLAELQANWLEWIRPCLLNDKI